MNEVRFDGLRLPTGTYMHRIAVQGNNIERFVSAKKLVVLK